MALALKYSLVQVEPTLNTPTDQQLQSDDPPSSILALNTGLALDCLV